MQRLIGVGHAVVCLVLIAQALQDQEGVIQGRLLHLDWLEAALQGGILFDVLAVFLKGRSTDGLQLATSQLRRAARQHRWRLQQHQHQPGCGSHR